MIFILSFIIDILCYYPHRHKEHNAHVHLVNHDHAHDTDHHHHHHTGQYEQTYCESFSPHTHEHGRHHRCEDSDCGSDSESETILVHRH